MCCRSVSFLVLLTAVAPAAQAQELASSLQQLRVLVKPGDTVSVTDASGREVRGTIAELSSSSLALIVAGERRSLPEGDIRTIRQRRADSLANGAKWGFGIGAGLGLLTGLSVVSEYEEEGVAIVAFAALLYGGIGAGVGVGIDAMIASNQVIYATAPRPSASVRLMPFVTRDRQGALLAVRF